MRASASDGHSPFEHRRGDSLSAKPQVLGVDSLDVMALSQLLRRSIVANETPAPSIADGGGSTRILPRLADHPHVVALSANR